MRPVFLTLLSFAGFLFAFSTDALFAQGQAEPLTQSDTIKLSLNEKPLRVFRPDEVLGYGIDGAEKGITAQLQRKDNRDAIRSLGLRRLTYRLRTELGVQAWHWNLDGEWSEPNKNRGYWTSQKTQKPILFGRGYALPRRGTTADQANNNGYSRLTDGDPRTFWKSNPYLDSHFTNEVEAAHPQWIVIDLERETEVNAIRLSWASPFAVRYRMDFCEFPANFKVRDFADTFEEEANWKPFPLGEITNGRGGEVTLRLCGHPRRVRFIRIWMTQSSYTAPRRKRDPRDRCGYAIAEIGVGKIRRKGEFTDVVRHAPASDRQTDTFASSTDPWHTSDNADTDTEQPGFEGLVKANYHHNLPIMVPVGVIYDTPENAVALIKTLKLLGIPFSEVELGEEPDGQYISPEDYAALYLQFAKAIHAVDPALKLGGVSLQTATEGWVHWKDAKGDRAWMRRFVRFLRAKNALNEFAFFSLEWYPFDEFTTSAEAQLKQNPVLLDRAIARLKAEEVPVNIPWYITEFGLSPYASRREVELPGAILDAEIVARFLQKPTGAAFFYGAIPATPYYEAEAEGATWGGLLAFLGDDTGKVKAILPSAHAVRLLTQEWLQPGAGNKTHTFFGVKFKPNDNLGAYAVSRPDGQCALLLLNRSEKKTLQVQLPFREVGKAKQYSPAQYLWHDAKEAGKPTKNLPPVSLTCRDTIDLPPFSITVVRWKPEKSTE